MASDISSTCAEVMDEKEEGEISFEDVSSCEEEEQQPVTKASSKPSRQSRNLKRGKENGKPKPSSELALTDLIPISSDSDMELVGILPKDMVPKKKPRKKKPSKKRTSSSPLDVSSRQQYKYPSRSRRREVPSRNRRRKTYRSRSPRKSVDREVDKLLKKIKEKENLPLLKEKSNILRPNEPSEEEDVELLRQRALDTKKPPPPPTQPPQNDEDEEDLELRMIALRSAILKKYKNKKRNNNNANKKRKISRDGSPFTELMETLQDENLIQVDMDLDTDIEKEKETRYSHTEETIEEIYEVGPIIENQTFLPPTYCSPTPEIDLLDLPPVVDVNQPSIFIDTPMVSPNLVPNPFNNNYRLLCTINDNSDSVFSVGSSPAGSFSPSNSLQEDRTEPRQEEEDEDTLRAILLASMSKKKEDQPPVEVEEIIPTKIDSTPILYKATYKIIKSKNIQSVTDSHRIVINLNSDTESEEEEKKNNSEDTRNADIEKSVDQFLKEVRSKHESNNADKDKVNGIDSTNTSRTVNKGRNGPRILGLNAGKSDTKTPPSKLASKGNANTTPAAVRHLPAFRQKEYHRLKQEIMAREKLQMEKKQVLQPFDKNWKIPKKIVAKPCLKVLSKDELNKKCLQVQIRQNVEERTVILGESDVCDRSVNSVVNMEEDTNIVTLEMDNLEKRLADMESKLVVERYKVLDDLSNMSSDLRSWNSGQELKRNLMSEVGRLKEQLKLAEEKLKEQSSMLNEMQPKVIVSQEKLKIGQEECGKLTEICARLGAQLIGKEYKTPEAGLILLNNKFKEVAQHKESEECSSRSHPYISVLSHLKGQRRENPNGIVCPFELFGTCSDIDCQFVHQSTTNKRKKSLTRRPSTHTMKKNRQPKIGKFSVNALKNTTMMIM